MTAHNSAQAVASSETELELSVVIPCLNEAETIGICIEKARRAMRSLGVVGEVVVADNGSTDGSRAIAESKGALVVPVAEKGYGAALMGGIAVARGRYVIMGDADDSYDFEEIPKFLAKLREGYDVVQGCRLPAGGGIIEKGAMPWLHRWIGNPVFTLLARVMYGAPVRDIYCGMRGFTKAAYLKIEQRCTGMEFATENIIKSGLYGFKIAETPITLHPDGRKAHGPHLQTFRDGWRTLRFFLMYSPRSLFLIPSAALTLFGIVGMGLASLQTIIFGATLDAHTHLVSALAVIIGYQLAQFAICVKVFAVNERMLPPDPRLNLFFKYFTLERGIVLGLVLIGIGLAFVVSAVLMWANVDFGHLDYSRTMRIVIPGVLMTTLGVQTVFSSFLMSLLGLSRKRA